MTASQGPKQALSRSEAAGLLPPGLVFADTPSRIAAYMLDSLVLGILVSIPPAVLGMYDYAYAFPPQPMPRATFVGVTIFTFAVDAAYFLFFWSGGRRGTPGQRIFGIQVANAFDGRPLTMTQAIERWLVMGWWLALLILLPIFTVAIGSYAILGLWWIILTISMIVSPTKQGIHDRFARSALVRPAGQGNLWAVGCLLIYLLISVFAVAWLLFTFWMVDALQGFDTFPPGMNPFELFETQIREFWPS